jgi:hypothetical protein
MRCAPARRRLGFLQGAANWRSFHVFFGNFQLIPHCFRRRCRSLNVPLQTLVDVRDSLDIALLEVHHVGDWIVDGNVLARVGLDRRFRGQCRSCRVMPER